MNTAVYAFASLAAGAVTALAVTAVAVALFVNYLTGG